MIRLFTSPELWFDVRSSVMIHRVEQSSVRIAEWTLSDDRALRGITMG